MTNQGIKAHLKDIAAMSQYEMAHLWRFAPSGHPFFDRRYPLFDAFKKRFKVLGGFTPEISKSLGWR